MRMGSRPSQFRATLRTWSKEGDTPRGPFIYFLDEGHPGTVIAAPGVIRQTFPMQRIIFGEPGGGPSPRGQRIHEHCVAAGFEGDLAADIALVMWEKFNLMVPFSGLSALTRLPVGLLRDDPDTWALFETLMRETTAVGSARGLRLPPDIVETQLAMVRSASPHHYASTATGP
jgi:2-dehydropantoate 2-reductase